MITSKKYRIVVAMSGGVDSSAVAGLLKEQGHEVIGLAMKTHGLEPRGNRACCTPDDMRDARKVADSLDMPFYVLNYQDVFRQEVILPFAQAYKEGRTPNPCVECNDKVKFRPLLERAEQLGADFLATGHYARILRQADHCMLQRGVDRHKDQSYFLYRMSQVQLKKLMFPVGGMQKAEVRAHAERLGLPVAHKQESQEICFVGNEGYAKTVENILGEGGRKGTIVNTDGKVLGEHDGIHHFTLGQRRGLRIAAEKPLYVVDIDAERAQIIVGDAEALLAPHIDVSRVHWSFATPAVGTEVWVQQRYREVHKKARIADFSADKVRLEFLVPEPAGAPGQAAVIYDASGETVLGGGTIAARTKRVVASEVQHA
jgi:tRNA-uridine 2-sulfurtransferase